PRPPRCARPQIPESRYFTMKRQEECTMKEAVKLVPVLVLLTAAVSVLAQERTLGTEPKPSPPKTDAKMHGEMKGTTKDLDAHLQQLKSCLDHERSVASNSGRVTSPEQDASDAQIQALEKSIQQLQEQLDARPHYLDQKNSLRP